MELYLSELLKEIGNEQLLANSWKTIEQAKNTTSEHTDNDSYSTEKPGSYPVSVTKMLKSPIKLQNNSVTQIKSEDFNALTPKVKGRRKLLEKMNPKKCNFCSQVSLNWKDFEVHINKQHRDKLNQRRKLQHDSQMFNFKIEPSVLDFIQSKKHLCEDCGTSYNRHRNLKRHVEVHHKGITYSAANLCEYFVSIHGQHKIRCIRDASSSGCCRSSLI